MLTDLRHGIRVLLQAKGWTAIVCLSLALGIGANTALFSAIDGMLLRKLPVTDPDRLVRLRSAGPNDMATGSWDYGFRANTASGERVTTTFSYPMYQHFRAANQTLIDIAAFAPLGRLNVVADGRAELASAFLSSGNYYALLGVTARLGRTIAPEDDDPAAPAVAVISDRFWRSRFAGSPAILGKILHVNTVPVTVIGVLPSDYRGVQHVTADAPDISVPLWMDRQLSQEPEERPIQPTYWYLQIMGRLKPGATMAQVQDNLEAVFRREARAGLDMYLATRTETERGSQRNQGRKDVPRLVVDSGSRGVYDIDSADVHGAAIFGGIAIMILLIVCANVANLLLSRAATRQKELAVRLSLGATRFRLVRQLLTESLLLAAVGGSLGIFVAYWGRPLLPLPASPLASTDWRVVLFTFAVVCVTGILFGLAPAMRATATSPGTSLKEDSRSVAASQTVLSRILVVAQVSISLVLLVGAGLFLRTLDNLRAVDVGFNAANLALFRVNPQLNRYDRERTSQLYRDISERLRHVPGVLGVTLSSPALLSGTVNNSSFFVHGRRYTPEQQPSIGRVAVADNFFDVMDMPIAAGRGFSDRDDLGAPRVAVINQAAAREYFPDGNPIGQRFGDSPETSAEIEIVGVLRDAKYDSLRDPAPPTMYVPYLQRGFQGLTFAVRTTGEAGLLPDQIRNIVNRADPTLPIVSIDTQAGQIERQFARETFFARACMLFGTLAVFVAAIGLFGLMSFGVARRTREIGIRMAMGAQREQVLSLVLRESMALVGIGIALGVVAALGAGGLIASQLFGVDAGDLRTIVSAVVLMLAVSAVACFLPARRATRVQPLVALRYE